MKVLAILFLTLACVAQSASLEPDIADIFYRLDGDRLVALERQAPTIRSGAHGLVVMSAKTVAEFPGPKSSVRFTKEPHFELVVRSIVPTSAFDPNTIYGLRRLEQKKKTRELVLMAGRVHPFGASTTTPDSGLLPVEFSQYGSSSLKMTTGELAPGEYAVGPLDGPAVFCFGVD